MTRIFSLCLVVCCSPLLAQAPPKPTLPDGPGKEMTVKLCGSCHAAELVMNRRETVEGWSGVVEDMINRGARGTPDEFGEVVDYLVAKFPKAPPAKSQITRTNEN